MIKRLALVSPYALSVPGGVQEQVLAMSRELTRRGTAVLIIAPDSGDTATYDTPAEVVRCGRLFSIPANGSKAPLALSRRASVDAARAISAFNPDLIHFHEPFAPRIGWHALGQHAFPAVGTMHRSGSGPAIRFTKILVSRLGRKLDVLTAVSEMAARTYDKSLQKSPLILFNGFEIGRFAEHSRATPVSPVFLVIGRLEERKGLKTVISAVQLHNQSSREKWSLRIVGDGPQRQELERIAKNTPEILFLGRVSDEEKRRELRSASALVAPALYGESFGLILIEGLASELPVVASDIDGYRQAGGAHVLWAQAGSAPDFARVMENALKSTTMEARSAALEYASRWSMETLMDQYQDVYGQAIKHFHRL
jgi:phosphatidyl-myo-inositol alpha-mannosyltransferase